MNLISIFLISNILVNDKAKFYSYLIFSFFLLF